MTRRTYGAGSLYQRADGRWLGTFDAGWTDKGTRRRVTVSAKTKAEAGRKLRDRLRDYNQRGEDAGDPRITVKAFADQWVRDIETRLRPRTVTAHRNAVGNWIVPTIGHRRLAGLTPADIRAVDAAQRDKGLAASSIHRNHVVLTAMLRAAKVNHPVPDSAFTVKAPKLNEPDRGDIPLADILDLIRAAGQQPDGSRWLFQFLYGTRQSETLGLTWRAVDFDRRTVDLSWQLQRLPYTDRTRTAFRVPDGYTYRQAHKAYCLVRPKSLSRIVPLIPAMAVALEQWRDLAVDNPSRLIWTRPNGLPWEGHDDTQRWYALQDAARVAAVEDAEGRRYFGHETRHAAATLLLALGQDVEIAKQILGHANATTTRGYQHVNLDMMRTAIEAAGARLQLG